MKNPQDLKSIIKIEQGKALEIKTSNQLLTTFRNELIPKEDRTKFIAELAMLCNLRNEDYEEDYKPFVDDWLMILGKNGFTGVQAVEMIQLAQITLPKYGYTKLTLPDIIVNWEKKQDQVSNIKYSDFLVLFAKIAKSSYKILNQVAIELTGTGFVNERNTKRLYRFLIQQINDIEKEKKSVEFNNIQAGYIGLIKYREHKVLSAEAEKLIDQIKLDIYNETYQYIQKYQNRTTKWMYLPLVYLYSKMKELKQKLKIKENG